MSIIVKSMEMPKPGIYILSVDNTGNDKTIFTITEYADSGKVIPRYVGKAVPVPPHGKLIDVDTLEVKDGWLDNQDGTQTHIQFVYANDIINASTIIEAEEE